MNKHENKYEINKKKIGFVINTSNRCKTGK